MSRISLEVWAQLESARPTGENLTARLAVPDLTDRLQCALDAEGRRHLLIALTADDDTLIDEQSRGLSVRTRELSIEGAPPTRRLDLKCEDAAGYGAFDLIGGEIATLLAAAAQSPAGIVRRVLAKWRRFWGQPPRTLLSREQQLGLFAELWFLLFWLLPRTGAADSVSRWRGPFGGRHDFEWLGRSVEVKASTRGAIHHINGIEQLAPPEEGDLLFFSLRVRDEAGATNNLPNLIVLCRAALATDADALTRFESTLALAGHSMEHDEEYAKLRLRVTNEELFSVGENFPRLTPASFSAGLPPGIEHVDYEINLGGFEHLRLARAPEEAMTL